MRKYLFAILPFLLFHSVNASVKDSTIYYNLPDSVKAIQFMAEINVQAIHSKKEMFAGIQTDIVSLSLESDKGGKEIVFGFPKTAEIKAAGLGIDTSEKGEMEWKYNWSLNETYKLLIATASDSAENFSLYSGYVWLPKENKWKLIGTCKIAGQWHTLLEPASFFPTGPKGMPATIGQVWIQRNRGSWKNLKEDNQTSPTINLFGHIDSIQQRIIDKGKIENDIASGKTDVKNNAEGVYYKMIKDGTGRQVSVMDTVTVNYRLTLFNDTAVVQETKDNPATFPLKGLIKGWQIGVPLCKVGGKIKLVIPSDFAYSIRTRAAKIPPNSILVFEIEVLDAKTPN